MLIVTVKNVPQSLSLAERIVSITVTQRKIWIYWKKIQYSKLFLWKRKTYYKYTQNTHVPYLRPNTWPTVPKHDYSLVRC